MSPPTQDEPFFYIRLPVARKTSKPTLLENCESTSSLETDVGSVQSLDFSQECKKYIAGLDNGESARTRKCVCSWLKESLFFQPLQLILTALSRRAPTTTLRQLLALAHWWRWLNNLLAALENSCPESDSLLLSQFFFVVRYAPDPISSLLRFL